MIQVYFSVGAVYILIGILFIIGVGYGFGWYADVRLRELLKRKGGKK
jgi:hypothetical protein